MKRKLVPPGPDAPEHTTRSTAAPSSELIAYLRQNRTRLREEWARRITESRLLMAMTEEEIFSEAISVYDNYVLALATGDVEALQAGARELSERIIPRGMEARDVLGIVLLLHDVLASSLFEEYQSDLEQSNRVLDSYEQAANRLANAVASAGWSCSGNRRRSGSCPQPRRTSASAC